MKTNLPKLPTLGDICNLDIKVEWVVDKLIPKQSVTVLHGKGGVGKSFLMLKIGCCASEGIPFVGLLAQRMPAYYVDFENSLPINNYTLPVVRKSAGSRASVRAFSIAAARVLTPSLR